MNKNRFVFVVPAYNAGKTIEKMLMSVILQNYDNWLILIRDDLSTDNTIDEVVRVCQKEKESCLLLDCDLKGYNDPNHVRLLGGTSELSQARVVLWKNREKFWETKNVLSMIRSEYVSENDIICRLDADDYIFNLCALYDINLVYEQTKCDVLWTANRWSDQFWKSNCGPIPGGYMIQYKFDMSEEVGLVQINGERDIYKHSLNNWNTSHLKTFRKYLINNVNEENFKNKDGEYVKRCGDRAVYYPVLHRCNMPVYFPIQTYYYRIDDVPETYQKEDSLYQKEESDFITRRGYVE